MLCLHLWQSQQSVPIFQTGSQRSRHVDIVSLFAPPFRQILDECWDVDEKISGRNPDKRLKNPVSRSISE